MVFATGFHPLFFDALRSLPQGLHLVNSKGGDITGRTVFKSMTDIPDPVDLAVITVPAARVLSLIPELKKKKIKNVLLISSGFAETGAEGKVLEDELVKKARGG